MAYKMEKKTLWILCAVIVFVFLAVFFGLHVLAPLLDPVTRDMVKIFLCGAVSGLLPGLWIGSKLEKFFAKEENKLAKEVNRLK